MIRSRLSFAIGLVVAVVLSGCGATSSSTSSGTRTVTLSSYGGVYQDAITNAWLKPYEQETGVKVVQDVNFETAKLKAQVDAGKVTWDVADLESNFGIGNADAKYLEPLDYSVIDRSTILPGYSDTYRIANQITGTVLGYNTKVLGPGKVPQTWADFFDLAKFPGKRCIPKFASGGQIEMALLGDGVSPANLYPLDVDRALRKLDTIKKQLIFWDSGAQSQQLLADGEASMCYLWNGRAYSAKAAGAPVGIQWHNQVLVAGFFGVPKGAPHKSEAMKLVAYIVKASSQARFSKYLPYGPINRDAKPDPSAVPNLPTTYLDTAVNYDNAWWLTNTTVAEGKWQSWLQK